MYKGAQDKQDWIARTGSHATRFSMRDYQQEADEVFQYHVPYTDPYRMRLTELKEEREVLLSKQRLCSSAKRRADHAGLTDDARRLGKIYMAICNRTGVLNSVIKSENVRLSNMRDYKAIMQAMREILPESKVQEILARKMELERQFGEELGLPCS